MTAVQTLGTGRRTILTDCNAAGEKWSVDSAVICGIKVNYIGVGGIIWVSILELTDFAGKLM